MTYIPNPDKPSEIEVMWAALGKLRRNEYSGKWDAEGIVKWLKTELLPMEEALERLDEQYEDMFPGKEYTEEIVAQEAQREYQWNHRQAIDRRESA